MHLGSTAEALSEAFPVLPLRPGRKDPAIRGGVHGSTRQRSKIREWWRRAPMLNVGIAMGHGSIGIDLDVKDDVSGFANLDGYAQTVAGVTGTDWSHTFTVNTPSGGVHLVYRWDGPEEAPNRVGVLPGVDVRGRNGYLVGPYSRIGNRVYAPESGWDETVGVEPDGSMHLWEFVPFLEPIPGWLKDLVLGTRTTLLEGAADRVVRHESAYLEAVLTGERSRVLDAPRGERNNALYQASFRLGLQVRDGRLEEPVAEDLLLGWAAHQREQDNTEAELVATVRSGLRRGSDA